MRYILCLLILCLPSFAFAQNFNIVNAGNGKYYPSSVTSGSVIPLFDDQAILSVTYHPRSLSSDIFVTSVSIVPSVTYSDMSGVASYGWYKDFAVDGVGYRTSYSVINAVDLFIRENKSPNFVNKVLPQAFLFLESQNLGTVQQRAAYIAGFKAKPPQIVNPGDILGTFTKMLGPWAYALVGMWIALIGLDLGTRNMKKVAGEAAKLERSARRTEINRQIKNDQTARVYQRKLRNMSHFLYTYTDRDDFYRDVRKRFKQTSADYAEYKASKGWIL